LRKPPPTQELAVCAHFRLGLGKILISLAYLPSLLGSSCGIGEPASRLHFAKFLLRYDIKGENARRLPNQIPNELPQLHGMDATFIATSATCKTVIRTDLHRRWESQRLRRDFLLRPHGPVIFRSASGELDNLSILYPPRSPSMRDCRRGSRAEEGISVERKTVAVEHPIHTGGRSVWPEAGLARRRRAKMRFLRASPRG